MKIGGFSTSFPHLCSSLFVIIGGFGGGDSVGDRRGMGTFQLASDGFIFRGGGARRCSLLDFRFPPPDIFLAVEDIAGVFCSPLFFCFMSMRGSMCAIYSEVRSSVFGLYFG